MKSMANSAAFERRLLSGDGRASYQNNKAMQQSNTNELMFFQKPYKALRVWEIPEVKTDYIINHNKSSKIFTHISVSAPETAARVVNGDCC